MRRRNLAAHACLPLRYHRITEAGDEHALVKQRVAHLNCRRRLADDDRNDRRLAWQWFEARFDDLFAKVSRILAQPLDALGMLLDQSHRRQSARRNGWR